MHQLGLLPSSKNHFLSPLPVTPRSAPLPNGHCTRPDPSPCRCLPDGFTTRLQYLCLSRETSLPHVSLPGAKALDNFVPKVTAMCKPLHCDEGRSKHRFCGVLCQLCFQKCSEIHILQLKGALRTSLASYLQKALSAPPLLIFHV